MPNFATLKYIAVENIVCKGEIACNKRFLLFSHFFFLPYDTYFPFQMHFKMSSAICFNLDQSKIFSSGNELNGAETAEFATDIDKKTFWEKEKMLVTNILSFSQIVFYKLLYKGP